MKITHHTWGNELPKYIKVIYYPYLNSIDLHHRKTVEKLYFSVCITFGAWHINPKKINNEEAN